MAGQIDIKDIFPILAFGGTRLDFGEVDLELIKGAQGIDQRSGAIVNGKQDGGAVVAGGRAGFLADDQKARGVGGAILDGFLEQSQPVQFRGEHAAECGGTRVGMVAGELGGLGGRRHLHQLGAREVFQDPRAALAEHLRVGIERLDLVARNGGHQAVFDAQQNLRADVQR